MLQRLTTFVPTAGPAGLRPPEKHLSGAACLVVASMLMDAEFGEFIETGVHPASGWTETGPVSQRFASQVFSMQRRAVGNSGRVGVTWLDSVGIAPWAAASQLSITSGRTQQPVRYLWYPVWRGAGHAFGPVVRSLHRERPALVFLGNHWRPRHLVLVVDADDEALSCYDPQTGHVQSVTRSRSVTRAVSDREVERPLFIVIPTGRRARS